MPWGGFVRPRGPAKWHLAYRADELAEAFGITRDAVYELARSGKIPSVRLSPRRLVFPRQAMEAMLKRGYTMSLKE